MFEKPNPRVGCFPRGALRDRFGDAARSFGRSSGTRTSVASRVPGHVSIFSHWAYGIALSVFAYQEAVARPPSGLSGSSCVTSQRRSPLRSRRCWPIATGASGFSSSPSCCAPYRCGPHRRRAGLDGPAFELLVLLSSLTAASIRRKARRSRRCFPTLATSPTGADGGERRLEHDREPWIFGGRRSAASCWPRRASRPSSAATTVAFLLSAVPDQPGSSRRAAGAARKREPASSASSPRVRDPRPRARPQGARAPALRADPRRGRPQRPDRRDGTAAARPRRRGRRPPQLRESASVG